MMMHDQSKIFSNEFYHSEGRYVRLILINTTKYNKISNISIQIDGRWHDRRTNDNKQRTSWGYE